MKRTRFWIAGLSVLAAGACLLAALPVWSAEEPSPAYVDEVALQAVDLEDEMVALSAEPASPFLLKRGFGSGGVYSVALDRQEEPSRLLSTEASGILVKQNDSAVVDYSNTGDGYVMVKYTAATEKRLKARVIGPTTTYTYNLDPGAWEVFPLSDGNGDYQVVVYENVSGSKYATKLSVSFSAALKDEFAPFLRPNQYVDYSDSSKIVAKAEELTRGVTDPLKKVEKIYDFVVQTLTYDKAKAANVASTYLPVLDTVLAEKKGICFDYAALMAGMLRSQGVPCKLVVGYAGSAYHAWISVWTEETGWVDGVIFFDGTAWKRMDPTFASSGKQSADILEYIGDGSNYTEKYLY